MTGAPGRTLAILGAGSDQMFLIRTAQQMGLRTLAFDMDAAAPGFEISDDHAVISTRDSGAVCQFLES